MTADRLVQSFDVNLIDAHTDRAARQPIRVAGSASGVTVFAEGYGQRASAEGHGPPVFLELYGGELRLLVWADINSEEPTHIIPLGGAREARREPDEPE